MTLEVSAKVIAYTGLETLTADKTIAQTPH